MHGSACESHLYIPPQIFCPCLGWHFIHSNIACVRQWSGMEAVAVWSLDIEAGCWDMKCHLSGGEGVWVSVWGWEILAIAGSTRLLERSWTVQVTAPSSDSVFLLGDFDTHVDSDTWRGWLGGMAWSEPDQGSVFGFCANHSLFIPNTIFEHKGAHTHGTRTPQVDGQLSYCIIRFLSHEERARAVNWPPPGNE